MTQAEKFQRLTCTQALRNDLRASSVRAAAFTWSAGVADFVLRLGSTAILARLILPEHFGLVMMVMAVTAVADQFRDLGLSTATVQQKEISYQEISNLFWINVLSGVIIALVVCAISPLLALYYKDSRLTVITCILATNFVWGGLLVQHQALLARGLKLGHSAAVRVLASFISTLVGVFLAWKGFGYWALVWKEVTRYLFIMIGMWVCFPWIPGLPCRKTGVHNLVRFGIHLSLANILASISSGADRFLIGRFWGAAPVAIYRQAYQLLVVPMDQLLGPMFQVTQPGLSLLQNDDLRYRRFYQKVLTIVCIATMPLSLFVAINSTEITRVVLGRKWLGCAGILAILSLGTFFKAPVSWSAHVLITRGLSRKYLNLTFVQNLTVVTLMLAGVHWGISGVATADVVATYFLAVPTLYYSLKGSPVTLGVFCSIIARPAIASVIMAIVLSWFHRTIPAIGAPAFLVVASVVAALTFLGTWILLPGGKTELISFVSDIRSALQRKVGARTRPEAEPVVV